MNRSRRYLLGMVIVAVLMAGFQHHNAIAQEQSSHVTIQSEKNTANYAGEIFLDLNLNGIREFGEPGVGSIEVVAEDLNGKIVEQTWSEADGLYIFESLPIADLQIRVVAPPSFKVTANGVYRISTGVPQGPATRPTGLSIMLFLPFMQG